MKTSAPTPALEALAKATGGKIVTAAKAKKPAGTKSTAFGYNMALIETLRKYRFGNGPGKDWSYSRFLILDLPNDTTCGITLYRGKKAFMLEIIREDIDIHIVKYVSVNIDEKRIKEIVAYVKVVSLINPVKLPKLPKFLTTPNLRKSIRRISVK